jgi:NTP pyrophosphatase (non-canonical NTP hydrolase)
MDLTKDFEISDEYILRTGRYFQECFQIAQLAHYALNKEKNATKAKFEDLSLNYVHFLLTEEVEELSKEVNSPNLNIDRILEEMADCAACLVGMYANIMSKMKQPQVTDI